MVFTFRLDFFQLKKEASNKPVEAISVKLLNVAVSALFVWLIPEVRNYLKRLYLEEIL